MGHSSLRFVLVVSLLGCGAARPLAGPSTAAELGNLGVRDAPVEVTGLFGGPVPAPPEAGCDGHFTGAPDLVLRPSAGALVIEASAAVPVAVLVHDASGAWHCSVGAPIELPPASTADRVRVWVGSPSPEQPVDALLRVEAR